MEQVKLFRLPKPEWIGSMDVSKLDNGFCEVIVYDHNKNKIGYYGFDEVKSLEIGRWLSSCVVDFTNSTYAAEVKTYQQLKDRLPDIDWDGICIDEIYGLYKKINANRTAPPPLLTYEDNAVIMPHTSPNIPHSKE